MKKIISFSLALVMLVTTLVGFAVNTYADETFVCGDDLTANYSSTTKTLTVSGKGEMFDYTQFDSPKWIQNNIYSIENIVINDGVTGIGDWAFANMYQIKNVYLPDSLTSIGLRAFSGCVSIQEFSIPANVENIRNYALRTSTSNESSQLTYIDVDADNQNYCSVDGVLYDKNKTNLIQIPDELDATSLVLPDTVETITNYAGDFVKYVQEITIPESIKTIQSKAFTNCESLQKVIFETEENPTIAIDFLTGTSAVIQGYSGSYIESFAQQNNIDFEPLPYCVLKFIGSDGTVTKVVEEIGTLPQDISAPALPETISVGNEQHMVYSWSPELATVTTNVTYKIQGELENHNYVEIADTAVEATIDHAGKYADEYCADCGTKKVGTIIPQLPHFTITAKAENGNVTVQGVSEFGNVAVNGEVTLVATPAAENYEFIGWSLNDKIVSTEETYVTKAIADATYVAKYAEVEAATFTVVFTDQYGNVYSTQDVTNGTEVKEPEEPVLAGFTFKGWSLTADEIDKLTASTKIVANFERTAATQYKVTVPEGCTIAGVEGTTTTVDYNTRVTVNAPAGAVNGTWFIAGVDSELVPVAYGKSYTFLVGSDITLTYEENPTVEAKPTVAAVSVERVEGSVKVGFLATRSLADGYAYVNAGFIYGKNLTDKELTLGNVGNEGSNENSSEVKALYCSTSSQQFRLSYGLAAQDGTAYAKAFLAYVDKNGETQVIYGELQSYTY